MYYYGYKKLIAISSMHSYSNSVGKSSSVGGLVFLVINFAGSISVHYILPVFAQGPSEDMPLTNSTTTVNEYDEEINPFNSPPSYISTSVEVASQRVIESNM
jgi:hypothetical protein